MSHALRRHARTATVVLRAIAAVYRERDVSFMARSIAYSAFVSLLPLLLLVIVTLSVVGERAMVDMVLAETGNYLTPAGQGLVAETVVRASGRVQLSVLSLAVLLWGTSNVFRGLDLAFTRLYGHTEPASLGEQVRDGILVAGSIALAVVALTVAGVVFRLVPDLPWVNLLNLVALLLSLSVVLYPVFYVFPDVDVTAGEVLPGVLVVATGWTLLHGAFQLYVAFTSSTELYGVLGGMLLLVTYLYFASVILLVGGVTNVVLAGRYTPTDDTVPMK